MSFDSTTRNKLQRMVTACRRLLTEEFNDQLQSLYGIYADEGRILELAKLTHLDDDHFQIATLLRDRIEHIRSGLSTEKNPLSEAIRRVLREQTFTLLNHIYVARIIYSHPGRPREPCRAARPIDARRAPSQSGYRREFVRGVGRLTQARKRHYKT